jgi:hypothetical protein
MTRTEAALSGATPARANDAPDPPSTAAIRREKSVDVVVAEIPDENSWALTDLLGRDMGRITLTKPGKFIILPAGNAMQTFAVIPSKPYATLDVALAAIEEHTRGVCRRAPK